MAEGSKRRWRPTPTNLIAGAMVITGLALTGLSWWFLLLAACGTLGPGLLRELGWLSDRDELQRSADHRAGYHAFLSVGALAFVLVAYFRAGGSMEHAERLATIFLCLLWFTWFSSSLISYWGPRTAARWILTAFGTVWLVFTIISNLGPEWTGWAALLLHPLLAAPFFVLGWLSARWPRLCGALLLAVAVGLAVLLGVPRGLARLIGDGVVPIFFLGPLVASGVALLVGTSEDGDDEGAVDSSPERMPARG